MKYSHAFCGCLVLTVLSTAVLSQRDDRSRSFSSLGELDAKRITGGDIRPDEICFETAEDFWCQIAAGQTACPSGCGACTTCEVTTSFKIKRCSDQEEQECDHFPPSQQTTLECGKRYPGACPASCVAGTWTSCIKGGFPSAGDCGTVKVTSCQ